MEPSDRVNKFVDAVEYVDDWLEKSGEELEKSRIRAHTAKLKTGKVIMVTEHNDKRKSNSPDYFNTTKEQALEVQERQIKHYGSMLGEGGEGALRRLMASFTAAHKLEDGKEHDIASINKYIPRGGAIEDIYHELLKTYGRRKQEEIEKSLIQALTRVLKNGKKVFVREHTNKVVKNPKSDEESAATISSLGAAAKKQGPMKPQKSVKQILKEATTERLQQLRYKLGGATHKTLLTSYKGKPLHFWLAAVENELGARTATA